MSKESSLMDLSQYGLIFGNKGKLKIMYTYSPRNAHFGSWENLRYAKPP